MICSLSIPPSENMPGSFLLQGYYCPRASSSQSIPWLAPSVTDGNRDTNVYSFLEDMDSFVGQLWFRDSQMALLKLPRCSAQPSLRLPFTWSRVALQSASSPSLTWLPTLLPSLRRFPGLLDSCLASASQRTWTISPFARRLES